METLATRLADSGATPARDLLLTYLGEADWDIDLAHNMWLADRLERGALIVANQAPADTSDDDSDERQQRRVEAMNNARLPLQRDNVERERRDAARLFLIMVNDGRSDEDKITMSPDEAILLLHLFSWDVQRATRGFDIEQARMLLHQHFDHMRTIGFDRSGRGLAEQAMRDERTAELVSITHRNDWYSAQRYLQQHGWNLPRAVSAWLKDGMPPVKHRHDKKGVGRRVNYLEDPLEMPFEQATQPDPSQDNTIWATERKQYVQQSKDDNQEQGGEDSGEGSDDEADTPLKQDRKRAHGFVINGNREPVQLGHEDPKRLMTEYLSKGNYYKNMFKRKYFWFPQSSQAPPDPANYPPEGVLDKARPVPFNWHNQVHIEHLNQWIRENYSRITGFNTRPRMQEWSTSELARLVALHEEHLQQLMRANSGKTREELLPMNVNGALRQRWTNTLNREFHSGEGHVQRKPGAVNTQRTRTRALWEHYGVKGEAEKVLVWKKEIKEEKAEEKRQREKAQAKGEKRGEDNDESNEDDEDDDDHEEEEHDESVECDDGENEQGENDESVNGDNDENEEDKDMYN